MKKVIFKQDNQNQPAFFPISFEALIPENHPVRVVNRVIDKLDISNIVSTYKGGGASSYHPRILLKILIYSYLGNTYSSRKIEKANRENIYYHWLNGQNFPDHLTINNFRGKRLKEKIDNIFTQVVILLNQSNVVALEEVFTDGTKLESFANRYSFVWKGSVEKNKEKLEKKIKLVLKNIENEIAQEDQAQEENETLTLISSKELDKKIDELNQTLVKSGTGKKSFKQLEKLKSEALPKLQEYESHLQKMGERNSYSKTDPDATFMRMKEDHMKNGQLKPAYNIQLSTEHNFITNYSIHQRPGDTATYKEHLESYHKKYGHYPIQAIADAGYGSLENYEFLDTHHIESYVKYNYFHKEQSKKFKNDISKIENLYYNTGQDYYICPMGQAMLPIGKHKKRKSDLGYEYEVTIYQAINCNGCPLNGACHKQKGNRKIEVNKQLIHYKQQSRENLLSKKGCKLRGRRCTEVEQTFGQIKWNKKFNRFLLRGVPKVSIEIGIIVIAHNIQKLAMMLTSDKISGFFTHYRRFLKSLYSMLYDIFKHSSIKTNCLKISLSDKNYCSKRIEMKKAA
jgi:transposase